jgi:hypothetical protein
MTAEVLLTVLAYGTLVLVAWLAVAGLLALVVGKSIRDADEREVGPEPTHAPGERAA